MRVCVVGGGLAGSLLAWRLAQVPGGPDVTVRAHRAVDATAASGGAVKAFEGHVGQRRLAIDSMAELLASPVLRAWSGYRRATFVSLRTRADGLAGAVASIDAALPGSTSCWRGEWLPGGDWALPGPRAAVIERHAGYTTPAAWRDRVLDDASPAVPPSSTAWPGRSSSGRTAWCAAATPTTTSSVLATGPWTPQVLRANGFLRCRISHQVRAVRRARTAGPWLPPPSSDDGTGPLRTTHRRTGCVLVGLPTEKWDVDPDAPDRWTRSCSTARQRGSAATAARLRLGPATRRVAAADCYRPEPGSASPASGARRRGTCSPSPAVRRCGQDGARGQHSGRGAALAGLVPPRSRPGGRRKGQP